MNIVLLGAPGAGKGTQAEIICEKLNIPTISTGAILRQAMKDGTEMGKKAKSFIEAGALVPDEVIIGIVNDRLTDEDCANGFILDGVPRTIAQAKAIDDMGIRIDMALDIEVKDQTIIERVSGRRVCACGASYHIKYKPSIKEGICDKCGQPLTIRKDDQPKTVLDRLTTYHELTEPLKDFYKAKGILVEIDGEGSVENTTALVLKVLEV
ncbi:MAG: adenylate kinase [Oscillospiraceae bacterium]